MSGRSESKEVICTCCYIIGDEIDIDSKLIPIDETMRLEDYPDWENVRFVLARKPQAEIDQIMATRREQAEKLKEFENLSDQ